MKALVKTKADKGLELMDVPMPEVGPNDVLIKIYKTAICGTDLHIWNWDPWAQQTIPVGMHVGHEFCGVIERVGSAVTEYQPGDVVSGEGHIVCGHCRNCRKGLFHLCPNTKGVGVNREGCFAEYLCIPQNNVIRIHKDMPMEIASILDPLGNATHTALSWDLVGEDVLITGAGLIGSMAAAVCKKAGAKSVTITDVSDYKLNLARIMGADRTVNVISGDSIAAARENGLAPAMIDRLTLNASRVSAMAQGMLTVAAQSDPVGKVISKTVRPNGLEISKVSVPFGVIGIIYEARPNVTADAAGICIKAGNAVILRGGKEAFNSNMAIAATLNRAAISCGLPDGVVQLIPWVGHEAVKLMLKMDRYIDLIIPRGGERLIRAVVADATMPVLKHYKGGCHLFVDENFDIDLALKIIVNAKCQRPGVCNALETLLVDSAAAAEFLPRFAEVMKDQGVEIRGDETVCKYCPDAIPATEDDYYAEYLNLTLAVRVVDGVDEAISHINTYGSRHSDGILSFNNANISAFTSMVDSSTVYVNASTRFTDGGEFGMGAEIGISTDKLHARGPMALPELTTYKYIIEGDGQIRRP